MPPVSKSGNKLARPVAHPSAGEAYARGELNRLGGFAVWGVVIGLSAALVAVSPWHYGRAAGVVLLAGLAAWMCGSLLGFLFGIPRVLASEKASAAASSPPPAPASQPPTPAPAPGSSAAQPAPAPGAVPPAQSAPTPAQPLLKTNSNLEEVSDWLTKIIVGAGLIEIHKVADVFAGFQTFLEPYVSKDDKVTPIVASIYVVFMLLAGFMWMYLETRIVLSRIFAGLEGMLRNTLEKAQDDLASAQKRKEEAQQDASTFDTALKDLLQASVPTGALAKAATSLKEAAKTERADPTLKAYAAQALAAAGQPEEARKVLQSEGALPPSLGAMMLALYSDPPKGFEEALRIGSQLSASPQVTDDPEYWFYLAAAFGQKHHYLKGLTPPPATNENDLLSARTNALDAARRCVSMAGRYRVRIMWLMHPDRSPTPQDDDLQDFAGDKDFEALITQASST